MHLPFYTADVFTNRLFSGAQIAVLPNADNLTAAQMQLLAREFNLSETVFITSSQGEESAFRFRIFTPHNEIDFAGQALIAAGHVLVSNGLVSLNGQSTEFKVALNKSQVSMHIDQQQDQSLLIQFAMSVKPQIDEYTPEQEELAEILSLAQSDLGAGKYRVLSSASDRNFLIIPAQSHAIVRQASFDMKAWSRTSAPATLAQSILLFTPHSDTSHADFHARLLGPGIGVQEDPPIGASIPAFVAYLAAHAHIVSGRHSFVVERGEPATRQSLLSVEMDNYGNDEIPLRVGGQAVMVSSGTINSSEPKNRS